MDERHVVALHVVKTAAHPRKALAETQVVGGVRLGGLAAGPVPAAAVLKVDHVDGMTARRRPALCSRRLLTQLRAFSKTCGPMIAEPIESTTPPSRSLHRAAEELEIPLGRPADGRAAEDRMVGDDVVADARMDGHRDAVPIRLGQDRRVLPAVGNGDSPGGPALLDRSSAAGRHGRR